MKKSLYFHLLIVFLIGLIPILWLPQDKLLFGHDAGIPFDPVIHFLDRLSVWSQRLGIGTDQSFGLLGAILIHGLEAFLIWIGFSIKTQQIIQFIFWFVLPGLTMYYLVYKIWPKKKYLSLIASVTYMVNFFLIQAWFVAERPKFSIYAALPLVVYFAIFYLTGRISFKKSIIATALILGLLNAGGSIPLYGGLLLTMGTLFLYHNFISFNKETIKRTVLYSVGVISLYILLNAYWLFSYIYYIFGFYSRDLSLAGGAEGALAWSTYLSKGATFINIFRGQGIPEWYLNPYHAFANEYLSNPLLIVASFVLPLLAYSSLFLTSEKRDKYFIYLFVLVSLVALVFTAGPRSQLGSLYDFLALNVPGFAIFRSNFYKFGYAFWFSYSILIGFALDALFSKVEHLFKAKRLSVVPVRYILPVLFTLGYVFYHYPIIDGSFLDYSREPGKELTNRVSVPQYVFDFGNWINQQESTKRYLIVPELSDTGYIAYDWGYWSTAPINSLQAKNSFVQNTFLNPPSERLLLKQLYTALLNDDMKSFADFTKVFAIDGVVVHADFDWKNPSWGTTDPAIYERILNNNSDFKLVKTFGKWKVYELANRDRSLRITATPKLNFLQGELENVMSFPGFDPISPLFMADMDPANASYFTDEATDIFVSPKCIQCDLKQEYFGFKYYNPKVLPGSVLYPLVLLREQRVKKQAKDFSSLLNHHLTVADRRIVEAKWIVDSKNKAPFLQISIDGYYKATRELRDLVDKNWDVDGKEKNKLARTLHDHLIQQVALIDSIFEEDLLNIEHRRVLSNTYDEILKIKKIADGNKWVTEDITDKRYIFDLPKVGTYDIYVKKKSLSNPQGNASSSTIFFGDNNIKLTPTQDINNWLYFGKMNFKNKQLRLAFTDSTLTNLLEKVKPEFPDGQEGIIEENGKISMTLDSRNKCFAYTVKNLDTIGTQYLVTFNYRNLTDKKDLGFYVSDIKTKVPKLRIRESFIPNSRAWAAHSEVVTPAQNSIKLNFCNGFVSISQKNSVKEREDLRFLSPGQTLVEVYDVGVYKISFPTVVFYQKQKNVVEKEYVKDFRKLNTVEYKVELTDSKEPVTLVMREGYGKYWQLCVKGGKCMSFNDRNHFNSAGFTNGWYFKDGLEGNLQLYYFPQRTYTIGAYIAIGSLFLIAGGILWTKLKRK